MNQTQKCAIVALAAILFSQFASGQYFIIDLDDQDPANRSIEVGPVYEGNQLWAKSRHFSNGEPSSLSTDWNMVFELRYGQYDTNGAVQFPGTWVSTNICEYLTLTNLLPSARTWFAEIIGTHNTGYTKTFMQGECVIEYSPGADTNMTALLRNWNIDNWTNNIGTQVSSNTARIVILEANTSTWNTVTGKLDTTTFQTFTNAYTSAIVEGDNVTPSTNGNVITYTVESGIGSFTNATIEGTAYTNAFILYAGTNIDIRTSAGTNYIDQNIDNDIQMNGNDIDGLGSTNLTLSSGYYSGSKGLKIVDGANNYWLLLDDVGTNVFDYINIEGTVYSNGATIYAGTNTTIRTENGTNYIDTQASGGSGSFTNANIEGTSYTNSFILYAGSNVTIRTAGTTNFIDAAASGGSASPIDSRAATNTVNMGDNAITNIDWSTSDDGTGSGLDADLLDGEHASAFEDADAAIAKTDEAETISANWINTANPWADNEVADTLTIGPGSTIGAVDGNSITNLDLEVYQASTNILKIQWWAASNRFAAVQVIGSVTNVTFLSP